MYDKRVNFSFTALGASKSMGIVEVGNQIVQGVSRKSISQSDEWDEQLILSTKYINFCII